MIQGASSTSFARTRGRNGTFAHGVTYPSPFFDISHTYLPKTVKELFQWCRYYFMVHPLVNAVVFKLSQYPIRDVVYHTEDQGLRGQWTTFLEDDLKYRSFQEEAGLDYYTYGNCLISIIFPFVKMLTCKSCKESIPARDANYHFRGHEFYLRCAKCGHHDKAEAEDRYIRTTKGMRLIRWNPEDVDIHYNQVSGRHTYYYKIPRGVRNDIIMGKKHVLEEVPQLFIESIKNRRAVVFSHENLYHFRRPTLSGTDNGWGVPLVMPILKDAFYLQVLKKAQEAIALEHIVPLRTLFPTSSEAVSAYNSMNLGDWKTQISSEIGRWRRDNNYMPILSFPLGSQSIGGDGRALLLGQEIRIWSEQILAGMGVPQELIFGGVSYSGSNVSLRMLENFFLSYMQDHLHLLQWIVKSVSAYMNWSPVKLTYKPFKMADDLQRQAYMFQLNQAGKVSDGTLLSGMDLDVYTEDEQMKKETDRRADALRKAQMQQAEIQGESQMIMAKYQMRAQQEAQEQMAPQGGAPQVAPQQGAQQAAPQQSAPQGAPQQGALNDMSSKLTGRALAAAPQSMGDDGQVNLDLIAYARNTASYLTQLDPVSRDAALLNIRAQSPELYQTVLSMLKMNGGSNGAKNTAGEPLPEQQAPRRGPGTALI